MGLQRVRGYTDRRGRKVKGYQRKGGKGRASADVGAVSADAASYDPLTTGAEHHLSKEERKRQRHIARQERMLEKKFPKILHDQLGVGRDGISSWEARYSGYDSYSVDAKLADSNHDLTLRCYASRDVDENWYPMPKMRDEMRPTSLSVRARDKSGKEHVERYPLGRNDRKGYVAVVKRARSWSDEVQGSDDFHKVQVERARATPLIGRI